MPERNSYNEDKTYWYIMFHAKPERIDAQLKEANRRREEEGRRPIDYRIPYLHMDRSSNQNETDGNDADLNNSLRNYLRYFIFIKATRSYLGQLLHEEWNLNSLYRLSFRYSHSGQPLHMDEDEMQQLMGIVAEYKFKFGLREFNEETMTPIKVRMKNEQFKDKIGSVLEIVNDGKGIHLTVGIPAFNNELIMQVSDIATDEVDIIGGGIDNILEPYLIRSVEENLIQILRRRVRHQADAETRAQDKKRLDTYSDIFTVVSFKDKAHAAHLLALHLLNACLRGDTNLRKVLAKRIEQTMGNTEEPQSDEEAFSLAILFVATRKGIYRKAVKDYVREHQTTLKPLLALMPVLKEIKTR